MTQRRFQRSIAPDGLIVYDLAKKEVVRDLTDYALEMRDTQQLSMLTLGQRIGHLIRFLEFLEAGGVLTAQVSDATLRSFRDAELAIVLKRSSAVGSVRMARETVNQKLLAIYHWLLWAQKRSRIPPMTMGTHGCRITVVERARAAHRGRGRDSVAAYVYPVLYRLTGARSKHRLGLTLTRATMERVSEAIMGQANTYVAHRDALIVDIATEAGLRRASINSLTVDLFERRQLETTRELSVDIKPASQKFDYDNEFAFPVWLALRVVEFIEGPRRELLARKPAMARNTRDHVFLSARTCTPLENRTLSQNVSRMLRSAGAGKGAGMHAFRRLFANEQIELEIDERLRRGLDTSAASICAAVSQKMGHANPMSLFAYVSAAQSRRGMQAWTQHRTEMELLKARLRKYEEPDDGEAL